MAKVIAPFKIIGTLDDLNFYIDQSNTNRVRTKGNSGVSSKEFMENPIYHKARNHGTEWGQASKVAQSFRRIALAYNNRAKDASCGGRGNKLMHEIIEEDTVNEKGARLFTNGMESEDAITYFVGFEGNKLRPLKKALTAKWKWDETTTELTIKKFNPIKQLDWPEEAEAVHMAIAYANWDYTNRNFHTEYSNELIIEKDEKPADIILKTTTPEGNHIHLVFFLIAFSIKQRKKYKELKRSNNTVSIIWSKKC